MTTKEKQLIEKLKELIEWLNQECPAVAPPLEPYTNYDLTHDFCDSLRIRLDEIASLESEIAKEQIMLCNWDHLPKDKYKDHGWHLPDGNELATAHSKEQEPEGVTAEDILRKYMNKLHPEYVTYIPQKELDRQKYTLEAMEAYAKTKQINLRDELIKFMESITIDKYQDNPDIDLIDEYLQSKEK